MVECRGGGVGRFSYVAYLNACYRSLSCVANQTCGLGAWHHYMIRVGCWWRAWGSAVVNATHAAQSHWRQNCKGTLYAPCYFDQVVVPMNVRNKINTRHVSLLRARPTQYPTLFRSRQKSHRVAQGAACCQLLLPTTTPAIGFSFYPLTGLQRRHHRLRPDRHGKDVHYGG